MTLLNNIPLYYYATFCSSIQKLVTFALKLLGNWCDAAMKYWYESRVDICLHFPLILRSRMVGLYGLQSCSIITILTSNVRRVLIFPHPHQPLCGFVFIIILILRCVKWFLILVLTTISVMNNDVGHILICLLAIFVIVIDHLNILFVKSLFKTFAFLKLEFLLIDFQRILMYFNYSPFIDIWSVFCRLPFCFLLL